MDNMRYKEVEAIFVEVVDLPATRRGERIAELTQDRELIQIVQQMLDENDLADQEGFMDASVLGEGVDWEASEPTLPLPERIGKYTILRALGHGASGAVYLAQAPLPLERRVAIKVLHTGAGELTTARFREEQRVLARLQNVGIAEVYDQGVTVLGMPFTVLEYIDGVSITEHCEQNRLDWRAIVELMTQCARAVSHAHQRNIIHRDLKPSNLMVTQKNDRARMKVIDFGTAKLTDPLRTAPHLTVDSQFIGTLTYSSPEQLSGKDEPDTRTDVHALGLVLYECLEGKHPFFQDNDGLKPMIDRIMTQPLPTISTRPSIPIREINAILSKACAKDIAERYSSMLHFGEDLQNLLSGLPVKAMRPRPAYIARKFIRRNWLLLSAVAIVVASLTSLAGIAVDRGIQASESRFALRETAVGLVDDVMPKLADLSGATGVRGELVASLRRRIDELLADDPKDRQLLLRKARILEYESDMLLSDERVDDAERLRFASATIIQTLLGEQADPEISADGRRLLIKLGDIAKFRKNWEGARKYYEQAHALLLADPDDNRGGLCWSYERLAYIAKTQKRYDDYRSLANQRLELSLVLLAEDPESTTWLNNCAMAEQIMAEVCGHADNPSKAIAHALQSRAYADRLVQQAPDLFSSRVMELSTNVIVMRCYYYLQDLENGLRQSTQVRALSHRLVERNPSREEALQIALQKFRQVIDLWQVYDPERDRGPLRADMLSLQR